MSLPWPILWKFVSTRWWALGTMIGLLAVLIFAGCDRRFFVYQASIAGARHLDAGAIYMASGVDKQNIFWIDPEETRQRILLLPGVKTAQVNCTLPAGVAIRVEERQPIVLLRAQAQERDWWLDEEGVVLPYHGDPYDDKTAFVVDSSQRHLEVGDRIEPEGLVRAVLQLREALPGVRVFFYSSEYGLSFRRQAEGGEWPVYVGSGDDLLRKIQVMEALAEYFQTNGIRPRYLDVRWADRPTYGAQPGED